MKVLIIGNGGREHALAWKIRQSPHVSWLGVTTGNGGTTSVAETVDVDSNDLDGIIKYVKENDIHLTVVGPEAPLAEGLVDRFESQHFIFGPVKAAAMLESSKSFAKKLMEEAGVPTGRFRTFSSALEAREYINTQRSPMVVKASGLAAGKGVFVCASREEAMNSVDAIMERKIFGDSGTEVIIEEFLDGEEVSLLAITDGTNYIMLPPSQDHKRIREGDHGPNTGGMGAYAPAPVMADELLKECCETIIEPVLNIMKEKGIPYKGVLYAGLMLTSEGPKVLEFNCRFGDPETQAILPLLSVDLVDLMLVSATGKMGEMMKALNLQPYNWHRLAKPGYSATVIAAAYGYPGKYEKGKVITGLTPETEELRLFHAGTKWDSGRLLTNGGRVIAATGLDLTLQGALNKAYRAINGMQFEGKTFRKDIGWRALQRLG